MQLAAPLKDATTLRVLDIGGNNIGPDGIAVLVQALKGHEALRSLELGYNPIGPEGVKSLVEVAKYDLQVRWAFDWTALLLAGGAGAFFYGTHGGRAKAQQLVFVVKSVTVRFAAFLYLDSSFSCTGFMHAGNSSMQTLSLLMNKKGKTLPWRVDTDRDAQGGVVQDWRRGGRQGSG